MRNLELFEAARKALIDYAQAKKDEKITIVTDPDFPEQFIDALIASAYQYKLSPVVAVLARHSLLSPPLHIKALLDDSDLIMVCTSSKFAGDTSGCQKKGGRVLALNRVRAIDLLRSLNADKERILKETKWFAEKLRRGKTVKVTTELGTDLTMDIGERVVVIEDGVVNAGEWDTLPGVIYTTMVEPATNGTIVLDGSMGWFPIGKELINAKINELVTLAVKEGKVVAVEGGMDARELARVLKEGGEGADIIGEIGIGLNPELQLAGNILVDEGLYGAAHVGIGHNVHLGGQNTASQHMDIVFTKATFEVDGEIIMENGCLKME